MSIKTFPQLLKFGHGNRKLHSHVAHVSIPSGFACPGALHCLAKADLKTGKLTDGPEQKFRCFSASQETAFKTLRKQRWANWKILLDLQPQTPENFRDLILASMAEFGARPKYRVATTHVRMHIGGDFFKQAYFDGWMLAAQERPDLKFYAYTKSLHFWMDWTVDRSLPLPSNVFLTASRGGRFDHLIDRHGLNQVVVVNHPDEAIVMHLEEDHDDSLAQKGTKKFALLLHGIQPSGSPAAAALKRMNKESINYSYGK